MPEITPQPSPLSTADLQEAVIKILRTVFDPEIPVNIYDLGLIYKADVDEARCVTIDMTLTSPNCPAAGSLPAEVENKIRAISGVEDVKLAIVWEPSWNKDMISDAAKLDLGIY